VSATMQRRQTAGTPVGDGWVFDRAGLTPFG
jgi:hypothetical protein